jgi:hypothetical protein
MINKVLNFWLKGIPTIFGFLALYSLYFIKFYTNMINQYIELDRVRYAVDIFTLTHRVTTLQIQFAMYFITMIVTLLLIRGVNTKDNEK